MDPQVTGRRDSVEELRHAVAGEVLAPGDAGYEDARKVWNGMIDRHPAAVVRAAAPGDVAQTVAFARARGWQLAVRGGGHGVAGNGTVQDGLVLDLGRLTTVEVDPQAGTVQVAGGATLGDVDQATAPHGLAVPLGVVSMTGVGGLTLGGGVGWLTRAHGLTVDNLLDARLVTADGVTVRAATDPELLWGLRGGGGNFGVVTAFTYQAHPVGPMVYCGNLIYAPHRWRTALRAWESWTRDLPDALQSIVTVITPPAHWGMGTDPCLIIAFLWASSDRDEGHRAVESLRASAPPDAEEVGETAWTEWQSAMDELFPRGSRAYWKNTSFDRLDEEVIDVLVRRGTEQTWFGTAFDIHHMGGAYARVAEDGTAFPTRGPRFWLNVYGYWASPADDAPRTAFVRGFAADMAPFATGGQYVNFLGHEAVSDRQAAARAVYGPEKLERLVTLKRRYDPENVFALNHNIPPQ